MSATTIFSWGYYGWGNHTKDLVLAADTVEQARGFKPPMFVDIRIRRTVRAIGFQGTNFEKLLGEMGERRYLWMKSLGNVNVLSGNGSRIQIAQPSSASELLQLADSQAAQNRRLVFFCSCEWPQCSGQNGTRLFCHRRTVADLLLREAKAQNREIQVIEWPGGEPEHVYLEADCEIFAKVVRGRKTIPLGKSIPKAELLGLPWGSVVTLRCDGEETNRIVGPARRYSQHWSLPVLGGPIDPPASVKNYQTRAQKIRQQYGLE